MTDAEGNEVGKLFVGGLSQATNNSSLRLYFSRFGEVEDAVVMMDNKTGRSRGFGYVKYRDAESVSFALEAKPHILDSKEIDAKQCNVNMKGRNRRSLKVFVGGIGLDQDADSIKNYFRQFGRVTDVNLMMDSNKQRHRGFAFVGFEDEAIVKRLINMHYVTMHNKQVEIKAMEPPNFGRKNTSTGCVNAASVMASGQPNDLTCSGPFDQPFDTNTLLASGLHSMNPQTSAFLAGQAAPLQTNLLGQQHQLASTIFDQSHPHAGYVNALMPEAMFSSPAYFQTISSDQQTLRAMGTDNAILPSSYSSPKHSIPYFLTGGQLHQAQTNSLMNYPTNASGASVTPGSSLYATIPCQLLPQSFLSSSGAQSMQPACPTPHASLSQLMGSDKANLAAWSGLQPAQFTLCSPQVTAQNGMLSCAQYPSGNSGTIASTSLLQQTQPPGGQQTLTPFYTMCPQYAAVQIQPENQATPIQYTAVNPSRTLPPMISSALGNVACSNPHTVPGSGDSVGLKSCLPGSRPSTPTADGKMESGRPVAGQSSPATFAYPTILMPTQRSSSMTQGATLFAPTGSTLNLNPAMWSQSANGVVYPQVPVGWSVHPSGQSAGGQQWHHPPVTLVTPPGTYQPSISSPSNINTTTVTAHQTGLQSNTKCNGSLSPGTTDMRCQIQLHGEGVSMAKASGDSLDSLIPTGEAGSAYATNDYPGGKIGNHQVGFSRAAHSGQEVTINPSSDNQQAPGLTTSDINTWQACANDMQRLGNSTIVPPWLISSNGSLTRWPMEVSPNPVTCSLPANMILHPSSWTVPFELLDESNSGYDMSLLGSQVPTGNGIPTNMRPTLLAQDTHAIAGGRHQQNVNPPCTAALNPHQLQRKTQITCEQPNQLTLTGTYNTLSQERQQTVSKIESRSVQDIGNSSSGINPIRSSVEYPTWLYSGNTMEGVNAGQRSLDTVVLLDNAGELLATTATTTTTTNNTKKGSDGSTGCTNGCGNTNSTKDLQANGASDVEVECQGPTGGPAGDFQRSIHMGHFNPYHVAH